MKTAESNQLQQTLHSLETSSLGPVSGPEEAAVLSSDVPAWTPAAGPLPGSARTPALPGEASRCLSDDELLDYQAGSSTREQREHIDAHLDGCNDCRTIVYALLPEPEPAQSWLAHGPARVTTFLPGGVVSGRYRIERFVARSGMGEVYEALDLLREKRVALKTMLCTSADDPRAVRALTLEVEHALLVSHANVCRVYELGEHRNWGGQEPSVRYLTMEFIDGETLGRRLRREPLPLAHVRAIALQLLSGLAAAHARGVLHLDFKSDNVMLRDGSEPPEAMIMDFGLSRTRSAGSALHPSERELRGTPGYMAPEQLECLATSRATDVYSFGVVLFEMLAGALPFRADSLSALLLKQLRSRPTAPSLQRPGLAPAIDAFVARCLEREPGRRYADAAQALAELERAGSWEASAGRSRRWSALAPVAGVVLLLGAIAVWRGAARWGAGVGAVAPQAGVAALRVPLPPSPAPPLPAPSSAPSAALPAVAMGLQAQDAKAGAQVEVVGEPAAKPAALAAPDVELRREEGAQRQLAPSSGELLRAREPGVSARAASKARSTGGDAPGGAESGGAANGGAVQPKEPARREELGRRHIPPGGFWLPDETAPSR